ncbi:MAG: type IV pilin N-terminal domain-containing protein [Thermoplasmata archaeon]|nr:MAG: type IV pilin N-terminal domain-containing protein [Thermoplasmata archaeon]
MKKPIKERPVHPGRLYPQRKIFDERGVSPVIAVILMVAITVVLAAVLYTIVSVLLPDTEVTPIHSVQFEEDRDDPGKYIGEFQGSVNLKKIEISVYDKSRDDTLLIYPDKEEHKEISGGLNFTYKDINKDDKLNAVDMIVIHGGESGDIVKFVYEPTGGSIATKTLN